MTATNQMTAEQKAALWNRVRESALLFVVPWIVVWVVLLVVHSLSGSSAWSGIGKLLLLFGCALLIIGYERWFIHVTGNALNDGSEASRYVFAKDTFLREVDDGTTDAALLAWCGNQSSANRTAASEQLRAFDNEGFKRLTQVVDKLQTRIGEEYSDIHSRTGWLVTGQAFLLTGFVSVLNADPARLSADTKQWLTVGIGLAGATISFVLALSIFYGTALVEALKGPRDEAETLADTEFKVPKTGVPSKTGIHIFSHYATRYIPCLTYLAWITLTLLAMNEAFSQVGPSGGTHAQPGDGLPGATPPGGTPPGGTPPGGTPPGGTPPGGTPPGGTPPGGIPPGGTPPVGTGTSLRGWKELKSSPSFALGEVTLETGEGDCPHPLEKEVTTWRDDILKEWKDRKSPSTSDVLILVGSADRNSLRGALRHQYDANMGLARRRAEAIKTMLMEKTSSESERDKLTDGRILVLVTGPKYSPEPAKAGQKEPCQQFRDDRRVQVWLPGG